MSRLAPRRQLPVIAWLTLVWVLLWGTWSWANLISGVVVSCIVLAVLPLPAVTAGRRVRPLALLQLAAYIARDLAVSSVQVSKLAVTPGPRVTSAVLAVRLETRSDLIITVVAEALSLVPGSVIVEIDSPTGTLYVHALGVRDAAGAERFRRSALRLERLVLEALPAGAQEVAAS
ncbi:Na+/H+ antiporter subunit E [Motilibacter aurantiacus]|uniref:Na+/H+ antiporter subunit E n=1 Tax=Motilibacter aurantiacus TaxID=2714955 RepID=UPI00140BDC45|nr:Na+/H+ antiporter subunit E [Motilibacter aurantiacus]